MLLDLALLAAVLFFFAYMPFEWLKKQERKEDFFDWMDSFVDAEWDKEIDYTPLREGRIVVCK